MWPFSQWTTAGRAALVYITAGAFTMVWAGVWYFYLYNNPPQQTAFYWCTGFMVTGLTMVLIGMVLGSISRSAQHVDLPPVPPAAVPVTVLNVQPTAAAPAPVGPPLNLASPISPNGQVVLVPPKSLPVNDPATRVDR